MGYSSQFKNIYISLICNNLNQSAYKTIFIFIMSVVFKHTFNKQNKTRRWLFQTSLCIWYKHPLKKFYKKHNKKWWLFCTFIFYPRILLARMKRESPQICLSWDKKNPVGIYQCKREIHIILRFLIPYYYVDFYLNY